MMVDGSPTAKMTPAAGIAPSEGGPWRNEQTRLATFLLSVAGASPFFAALQREVAYQFPEAEIPATPKDLVDWFTRSSGDPEEIQGLFYVVRSALQAVPVSAHETHIRRQCEEAASALYCIAACRVVDQAAYMTGADGSRDAGYWLHVPSGEHIICAVIATALFGGVLRLVPVHNSPLPRPEYVFEVASPGGGDLLVEDFERAAYVVLFPNDRESPEIGLDTGPLSAVQRENLAARFRTIKKVRKSSLAFIVRGPAVEQAAGHFAITYRVPVMVPDSEATTALLGMSADTLLAEIREFWAELEVLSRPAAPSPEPSPSSLTSRGPCMPSSGPSFTITAANVAISTGSHSAAQSGEGHTAHVEHRQAADLANLMPLFRELVEEIGRLSSPEKRDELTAHVELAQHEAGKTEKADIGRIKRAVDVVKFGVEGLENSGRIISLCNGAYKVLAPLLGLPLSPLP